MNEMRENNDMINGGKSFTDDAVADVLDRKSISQSVSDVVPVLRFVMREHRSSTRPHSLDKYE